MNQIPGSMHPLCNIRYKKEIYTNVEVVSTKVIPMLAEANPCLDEGLDFRHSGVRKLDKSARWLPGQASKPGYSGTGYGELANHSYVIV